MLWKRLGKHIIIFIILVVTLACGCNLPKIDITDWVTDLIAKNLMGNLIQSQKGYWRYDSLGVACTIPEGYIGYIGGFGGTISADRDLVFPDPLISILPLEYEEGKDFDYWVESGGRDLIHRQDADIISEAEIQIAGRRAYRWDYSVLQSNPDDESQKALFNGFKVNIDLPANQVLFIIATWPVEQDEDVRPLFESWLESLEIYEPIIPTLAPTD